MRACREYVFVLLVVGGCGGSVSPPTGALLSFDRYHRVDEFETYLEAVTSRHATLARLVEYGHSREGRRLLAVEIFNPATGPADEKAAFYLDGNIHGGEVLGGEAALYFINHLLSSYGRVPEVTELVDTRVFYVAPMVNPDGRAISVNTPENHRWNVRPVDEDRDGRMDEDPPEDLDGDGRILQMRFRDPLGGWKVSAADPRVMIRRAPGDSAGEFYRLYGEGIDNDGDGRINEDRIGGVDLNRNFPSNWSPSQFASGPYPLSEPETHALVDYITARPNIAAIHTYHTSGGLLLRFPTLAHQDWTFPGEDLAAYDLIAREGVAATGYEHYASDKQAIVDLMNPGHGVFNDWGSNVFGVLAMTTEMWKRPLGRGPAAMMVWNDDVLEGRGFIDWYPFDHPEFGAGELGGWDRWSTASPPEGELIEEELRRNTQWVIGFAKKLPRVDVLRTTVTPLPARPELVEVTAAIANVGWMATATVHASEVLRIAQPVRVFLSLDNARLIEGEESVSLGVLPGTRGGSPEERPVRWRVEIAESSRPARAEIAVVSEKGGTARASINLTDRNEP